MRALLARMRKVLMIVLLATALVGGCKKKKDEAATTGSAGSAAAGSAEGSAAAGSAAAGSADEGSAAATPTEGSAAAAGDTPAAGGPRPASVTDAHVAVADKMVKVFNDFGDAMKTAGTDCKAATAATKSFVPKFKEIGGDAEKIGDLDKDPEAKKWFEANYAPKMMAAMGPMMQTAQACQNDKDFQAAMQAMQEAMPKDKSDGAAADGAK